MSETDTTPSPVAEAAKLDDLMMAMDVVDTLRHQDSLIARELGQDGRDATLRERLRGIYEGQGLEVSDRILKQGIAALKESRFVYQRRGGRLARNLAMLWVRRAPVGAGLGAIVIVIIAMVSWSSWQRSASERTLAEAQLQLSQTLPAALGEAGQAVLSETADKQALDRAARLIASGETAIASGDIAATRTAINDLKLLHGRLISEYTVRIVSRPNEQTGVFRIPDVNKSARNYYLIVEAVTPSGEVLSLPILNEEDGSTEIVSIWAVRVPKSTFDEVAADKRADGIVDSNRLGEKRRGNLSETYLMRVEDGRIRTW
jgi:hypothetical protein